MSEEAEPFELGELGAHGRGGDVEPLALDKQARGDGAPLETYSSTTPERMRRWRSERSVVTLRPW